MRTHYLHLLFLLAVTLVSCAQKPVEVTKEFVYLEADFPQCHASTIAELKDGTLLTAFFLGTRESADDVSIYLSRKQPGQEGWSTPVMVASDSLHACWNPVLMALEDGRVLLFYKTGPNVPSWKGHLKTSLDGGLSWSEDYVFEDGLLGAIKNKPVRLPSGRIISGSSNENNGWRIHFEISDDGARSWRKVGPIAQDDSLRVIQPTILRHKDGTLQALCRSANGKIATTISHDDGQTWSRVTLTDFPQNNSGLDAVTLKDGRFALVCNPVGNVPGTQWGDRTPLEVFLSEDAIHWEKIATLETDDAENGYCYPSIIEAKDGSLNIVYTWRRERIAFARIVLP